MIVADANLLIYLFVRGPMTDAAERAMKRDAASVGSYDCEYITLARASRTRVVTADKKLLLAFPDVAVGIEAFADGG